MKPSRWWVDCAIGGLVFASCFLLYNATLTPSLSYASPDGNELTTVAATLGLAHPTGYPLFTWLGFLFTRFLPVGDVAHRTNLMSAILGAGGVAMLYHVARRVELHRPIAVFAALLFGFSTTFWSQTVITEVYAPNVLMLGLTVWLLLCWADRAEIGRRDIGKELVFVLFAFSLGLALGTHLSNLGYAPALALFVLFTDWRILTRPMTIVAAFFAFLAGAAQFLWVPLRAATLLDPLVLRFPPTSVAGMYIYTFGAFSNLRFAFPITAMPDRIVTYFYFLQLNFSLVGVLVGILGAWALLFRHPRRFWLFIGMYSIHVWFFSQYRVFDLDVFFIPSHFVFAILIGFGAQQIFDWLRAGIGRLMPSRRVVTAALALTLVVFFFVPITGLAALSYRANDRTRDTAIEDFYRNVFQILPPGSVLIGRRGVFGYDMFYWRNVYHLRPDVIIPMAGDHRRARPDAPLFTTVRVVGGEVTGAGPWAPPRGALPEDAWYVPVLVGNQRDLVLYRASQTPPPLVAAEANPQVRLDRTLDGLVLVGYDMNEVSEAPKPRVHVKTYWRITQPRAFLISTRVDDWTLETHDLGFGNLARYIQSTRPARDGLVVEEFDLVVPSTLKPGDHAFSIGLAQFTPTGVSMQWVDAGTIQIARRAP